MIKKILAGVILALGLAVVPSLSGAMMPTAWADPSNVCDDPLFDGDEYKDLKEAAGCNVDDNKTIMPVIMNLIQVVLAMIGLIAVVVLVYGGIMFVTSTGDTSKVQKAKNIVIYAIVGIVAASLAFAIVHFVSINIGSH